MSLWSYCDTLLDQLDTGTQDRLLTAMSQRITETHSHWLFRPELQTLLNLLKKAHHAHAITGCFILSNNGSARLVELIRRCLNVRTGSVANPKRGLFVAGWHRTAACRGGKVSKSFEGVIHCLQSVGLPPPSTHADLLFYDDLDHVMSREIPHYVRVPAYYFTTPHRLVFKDLKPIFQRESVPQDLVERAFADGEAAETADLREDPELIPRPPSPGETAMHMSVFVDGFRRFIASGASTSKTRRHTHSKQRTRKTQMVGKTAAVKTAAAKTTKSIWRRY
jgi:hypothetical protein